MLSVEHTDKGRVWAHSQIREPVSSRSDDVNALRHEGGSSLVCLQLDHSIADRYRDVQQRPEQQICKGAQPAAAEERLYLLRAACTGTSSTIARYLLDFACEHVASQGQHHETEMDMSVSSYMVGINVMFLCNLTEMQSAKSRRQMCSCHPICTFAAGPRRHASALTA